MLRFRESFRGYNRDDVNAYLEQLNANFSKKEAELRAIISELQLSLESADNEQNNLHESEINALNTELEEMKAENERLRGDLDSANKKYEAEANEKSRLYDSMTSQVGGIIIQANANAEKIISDARIEAESIRQNAVIEAKNTVSEAEKIKNEARAYADSCIRTAKESCVTEFDSIVTSASNELALVCDKLKSRTTTLVESLKEKSVEAMNGSY